MAFKMGFKVKPRLFYPGDQASFTPAPAAEPVISSPEPSAAPAAEPAFNGGTPNWGLPTASSDQAATPMINPILSDTQVPATIQPPAASVTPAAAQPEVIDFAGRKIEISDPSMLAVMKEIQKDYTNLQGTYTRTNQEAQELRTKLQSFEQQQQQPPAEQPPAAQPPAQMSPEDLEKVKEEFMDRFYEDPMGAISGLLEEQFNRTVKPVIEPITQERAWQEQINTVSGKYEDFTEYVEPMKAVLQEMPHLADQGLETVYLVAKGRTVQPAAPAPTPEQMLADPNFVNTHVMTNPQIQQQIVSQYLSNKQTINQQTPPVMGGQPGGAAPAIPENRPTNIRDASKAFLRHMGL